MWSMDKGTRWKFTSQKRCSEPLPYGHGSERLWISTFMSHTVLVSSTYVHDSKMHAER